MCPTPPRLHPGGPQVGGGEGGEADAPSPPLRSRPPVPRTLARVRSSAAGEGVETQRPRERAARSGEGASGSAGSAPHSRRKGRGGGGRRAASQTRQRARRGRSARDRVAPSGSERARRQRGHVRGPSSCALPPPRAALSIHKFSACSAATGHRSPPGTPRSRPPARPPWAARPGAEAPPPSFKMQPTPTMATAAASTAATAALTSRWDNTTSSPTAEPDPILNNYVLLVVVLSLFVGGTLVVLSGVLLLCRRCWEVHRRFNRAMEEAEKTTTTYLDSSAHPAQDPDFRGEDPEGQDAETERFLSTSSTGRRVSFNEAALFEQSRKSQDKGRRSSPSTSATWVKPAPPPPHTPLPPPRPVLPYSSSALPGDPYNSAAGPADFEISPLASSDSGEGAWADAGARSTKPVGSGATGGPEEAGPGSGAGPVLHFFTRLRRHTSLDGASPYFKVKKWKLDPSQRASSLDTRGSPKRHHFQRQRAASESTEQEEGDAPHMDFIQYIASAGDTVAFPPPRPFLASPASPSPALGRYFVVDSSVRGGPVGPCPTQSPAKWPGEGFPHPADISHSSSSIVPPGDCLTGATSPARTRRGKLGETGLEAAEEAGAAGGASPESPPERSGGAGPEQQQESDGERDSGPEQAQTTYRDIWSLRASLELHAAAASDHSSSGNDRDSVRSGDSSGSGSGTTVPTFPPPSPPPTPRPADSEAGGPRKLLQMDSGYASIEGRGAGEDGLLSASEKRSSFTSAGRTATVGTSFEGAPAPTEAPVRPRSPRAWPRRAPRRDYSIDEKTDALFHEFLRHDPHFDDTLPSATRHRVRAHPHTRKQWQQRGRQHSDPGARATTPAPPAAPFGADSRPTRAPLRRGDSVDCPPEGRAGDEPAAPAIPVIEEEPGGGSSTCPGSGLCVGPPGTLLDKLVAGLDDRLFPPRLAQPIATAPTLAAAAPTSPDHSPA
ncbi:voltage-dependent calcium channel beta subunit-associated regulatory protein isoform X5 [Acinonyx jubatus]|uniref:Voltage-dependent calcium channel beta subunit-associated regulatory protein isoform X5 n=1 Tax=Acinonyx jubatus TaxID=32536 RepID=A0ABM3PX26_ACIJB|nr:voltage-dependent calcium channel beta subunit-associated regulatory protein isoform X5 [Acinonyx jubatus]